MVITRGSILAAVLGCALLVPTPWVAAQEEQPATAEAPEGEGAEDDGGEDLGEGIEGIDDILRIEDEAFADRGYVYDPGTRRDPFRSLLAAVNAAGPSGPRPEGIPGLLVDEIDLTGIFRTPQGFVAQVRALDQDKSFLIRQGDQLFDGDVVSIDMDRVVFKQIVQDPTALKPFREVVKTLNPGEG